LSVSEGLPPYGSTSAVEVLDFIGQNVVAGTYATGVFKRPINEILTSINSQIPLTAPSSFELEQNFPNPLNLTTTIKFTLPEREMVSLVVYNSLGQEVVTLVDGVRAAGSYNVVFNGDNLSSGVYFYRLAAGKNSVIKKMLLIRKRHME